MPPRSLNCIQIRRFGSVVSFTAVCSPALSAPPTLLTLHPPCWHQAPYTPASPAAPKAQGVSVPSLCSERCSSCRTAPEWLLELLKLGQPHTSVLLEEMFRTSFEHDPGRPVPVCVAHSPSVPLVWGRRGHISWGTLRACAGNSGCCKQIILQADLKRNVLEHR